MENTHTPPPFIVNGLDISYANEILDTNDDVFGEIYMITNKVTNKKYIGQTLSHRLNHGKYRPFGYIGRFNDHKSAARCNTKKNQSIYLCNAIRKYGEDAFSIELLCQCPANETDFFEIDFISEHKTLYPKGYNLTSGGKTTRHISHNQKLKDLGLPGKRGGCEFRSAETREKMKIRAIEETSKPEVRRTRMAQAQKQHWNAKFNKLANIDVDVSKLDSYIHKVHWGAKNIDYARVVVSKIRIDFRGLHEPYEIQVIRAKLFLLEVALTQLQNKVNTVIH